MPSHALNATARQTPTFLTLGFRPFLVASASFAALSMLIWGKVFLFSGA